MIMLKMGRVRSISDRPLGTLLDSEKAERAITLAGGCFTFATLGAYTTRRLASTIANKEDLLQARHCLLRATNDNSIAD